MANLLIWYLIITLMQLVTIWLALDSKKNKTSWREILQYSLLWPVLLVAAYSHWRITLEVIRKDAALFYKLVLLQTAIIILIVLVLRKL